jgi:hypothetical protein
MMLIRTARQDQPGDADATAQSHAVPPLEQDAPLALSSAPTLEQTVRAWYEAGHSQRAIARKLNIDRRKVKRILDEAA